MHSLQPEIIWFNFSQLEICILAGTQKYCDSYWDRKPPPGQSCGQWGAPTRHSGSPPSSQWCSTGASPLGSSICEKNRMNIGSMLFIVSTREKNHNINIGTWWPIPRRQRPPSHWLASQASGLPEHLENIRLTFRQKNGKTKNIWIIPKNSCRFKTKIVSGKKCIALWRQKLQWWPIERLASNSALLFYLKRDNCQN